MPLEGLNGLIKLHHAALPGNLDPEGLAPDQSGPDLGIDTPLSEAHQGGVCLFLGGIKAQRDRSRQWASIKKPSFVKPPILQ